MKPLIIIPTYNEIENIGPLTQKITETLNGSASRIPKFLSSMTARPMERAVSSKRCERKSENSRPSSRQKNGSRHCICAGFRWGMEPATMS